MEEVGPKLVSGKYFLNKLLSPIFFKPLVRINFSGSSFLFFDLVASNFL